MRNDAVAVALAGLLLLAGCHSVSPVPPLEPAAGRLDEKLAFGGVLGTYEPAPDLEEMQTPPVDRVAISKRIDTLLVGRGTFSLVDPLDPRDGPETIGGGKPGWAERAQKERRKALVTRARQTQAKLGFEVDVVDARVRYLGQSTPLLVWKALVLLGAFPFPDIPNWFLSSDRFELTIYATCRLLDAQDGAVQKEQIVEGKVDGWFGDFSRGFYYYGFLRMPGALDDESWREIVTALAPGAERAVAQECVRWIEQTALSRATGNERER